MEIDLTLNVLEETVSSFFKDFFDEMDLRAVHIPTKAVVLTASRKGFQFKHTFNLMEWDVYFGAKLQLQALRSIRSIIVRQEQALLMEKPKVDGNI
ncbi:hypothetical protein [Mucilaginibacter sp. PAMB04168]|uniref:hypothetical protein n=1 Tax=Mucilaginibacter sp. PAMB04168 TaxID=3138567 RepID=UPI0031F6068F